MQYQDQTPCVAPIRRDEAELLVSRLEALNADNRKVLAALNSGSIKTYLNRAQTTDHNKALYRQRIAALDDLISRIRAIPAN